VAKYNWGNIRDDYEMHGLSYSQLSAKYGCSRGLISGRAKKDAWDKQKVEQAIDKKAGAVRVLAEITEQNRTDFGNRSVLIDKEAERRLEAEGFYNDAIKYNQALANRVLKEKGTKADLQEINMHSQLTNRNKEGVLGKMPTTQVNIQNNVSTDADSVIERLKARHQ